jgi:hypothetical protein
MPHANADANANANANAASGVLPSNGINGASMPLSRHRWSIDAATGGQVGVTGGQAG